MCRLLPLVLLLVLVLTACKTLPPEKFPQANLGIRTFVADDSLRLVLVNPLHCPVYVGAGAREENMDKLLERDFPIVLAPGQDSLRYAYPTDRDEVALGIKLRMVLGDPADTARFERLALPFPTGRSYGVLQGYNGSFSHHKENSRYALDFSLAVGDTVCAAADGFVVGMVEGYSEGANSRKWRDYANVITVYHPRFTGFTQYVHLDYRGSFVEVGDSVRAGQAIGLAGMTGFTAGPHLHFNVFDTRSNALFSVPVDSIGDYLASDLVKGDRVRH
ncbi:M23 family metallopeptidase [Neolewinella antarctica]|uniref:Murein DD-endopeptidase MepM/ murein hydrolase activator NlpD n=1 Tax=Neolewinella antarctica TaxID=442734 RepID=A0ABX0XFJ2_9BACT|nr:M23 family metallopeptidase [Neolewinella antarctica]NJC28006.1 murein DD-endopeptidase MepM/ murein hydrolase activator NlpD [Neolewinella antarctica]